MLNLRVVSFASIHILIHMKRRNGITYEPPSPSPETCLTLSPSAADLSTETGLDGSDGTTGTARVAGDEVETVFALVEFGIGAAAGFAGDVFNWYS